MKERIEEKMGKNKEKGGKGVEFYYYHFLCFIIITTFIVAVITIVIDIITSTGE